MFSAGREDVTDEEHARARKQQMKTLISEEKYWPIVKIIVRDVAEYLNIPIDLCHSILIHKLFWKDTGHRVICAKIAYTHNDVCQWPVYEYSVKYNAVILFQPPYSSPGPCGFFLLPKLKRPITYERTTLRHD